MSNSPIDRVLSCLEGVKKKGNGWIAKCPAHDDNRASFSVNESATGAVLLKCHAGCALPAILSAMSLQTADLFPAKEDRLPQASSKPRGRVVAAYDYTDESGKLLYQAVRFEPKGFSQRKPNGRGGWDYSLAGVPRVLYRLSEVKAEVERGGTVFVVEGEKDADRIASLGWVATTNAAGAGKWIESYTDSLKGDTFVVVLPDNDDAGAKHVQMVASSCYNAGIVVRVVNLPGLPPKGDVSDWLDAGGTADKLTELVNNTRDWEPLHAEETTPAPSVPLEVPYPDPLSAPAFYGLAGDIVNTIAPHTESDMSALLIQFLVAFGNIIGRNAYYLVEADKHHTNLFAVVAGNSGKGRKGTSWGHIKRLFGRISEEWMTKRVKSGLSSGEGLINAVADSESEPSDKRLLTVESEFATLLRVMEREGNTISARIRDCWDTGNISTLTKNPLSSTGAHVSIIGHVTGDELRRYLTRTESGNGFANRFLWVCAKRSKLLPDGGDLSEAEMNAMVIRLQKTVTFAGSAQRIQRDESARALWHKVYPILSRDVAGLVGAVTSRAEAQVTRLSLLYALLDQSDTIRLPHLQSALAVWKYCEASARYIFGDATGDPVSDVVLAALKEAPEGLTTTDLHELLNKNYKGDRLKTALRSLEQGGMARSEKRAAQGGIGRPAEVWYAISITEGHEFNEENELRRSDTVLTSLNSFDKDVSPVRTENAPISKYDNDPYRDVENFEEGEE